MGTMQEGLGAQGAAWHINSAGPELPELDVAMWGRNAWVVV